jgi:asparagine synthetase B (glutamine-hydrolysing)
MENLTSINSTDYKFTDFYLKYTQNFRTNEASRESIQRVNALYRKIRMEQSEANFNFSDDRLIYIAFKLMLNFKPASEANMLEYLIARRYAEIYAEGEYAENLKSLMNKIIQLNTTEKGLSSEQEKEFEAEKSFLTSTSECPKFLLNEDTEQPSAEQIKDNIQEAIDKPQEDVVEDVVDTEEDVIEGEFTQDDIDEAMDIYESAYTVVAYFEEATEEDLEVAEELMETAEIILGEDLVEEIKTQVDEENT